VFSHSIQRFNVCSRSSKCSLIQSKGLMFVCLTSNPYSIQISNLLKHQFFQTLDSSGQISVKILICSSSRIATSFKFNGFQHNLIPKSSKFKIICVQVHPISKLFWVQYSSTLGFRFKYSNILGSGSNTTDHQSVFSSNPI